MLDREGPYRTRGLDLPGLWEDKRVLLLFIFLSIFSALQQLLRTSKHLPWLLTEKPLPARLHLRKVEHSELQL